MSSMSHFAECVSEEMGLGGEITDEVMERGAMLLNIKPTAATFDGFRVLWHSQTHMNEKGATYALYRDVEGWDHPVTSVSRDDNNPWYLEQYPDAVKVGRGYFVRGCLFASADPREYGHVKGD